MDIQSLLNNLGYDEYHRVEQVSRSYLMLSVYVQKAKEARKLMKALTSLVLPPGWHLKTKNLKTGDWLTKWQRAYKISPFGRTFSVVPYWQRLQYRRKQIPIYIEPKGAFGSGTHASTRGVIQLMEPLKGKFRRFFDIGTGTGVLAFAAHYLGAQKILAVDHDKAAVDTARLNASHNAIRGVEFRVMDIYHPQRIAKHDLVVANLISQVLVDTRKHITSCVSEKGYLILSGIEKKNFPWVLSQYQDCKDLKLIKIMPIGSWRSALFCRRSTR